MARPFRVEEFMACVQGGRILCIQIIETMPDLIGSFHSINVTWNANQAHMYKFCQVNVISLRSEY